MYFLTFDSRCPRALNRSLFICGVVFSLKRKTSPKLSIGTHVLLNCNVESLQLQPRQLVEQLRLKAFRNLYFDGGKVIQSFIREGLMNGTTITTIPLLARFGNSAVWLEFARCQIAAAQFQSAISGLVQRTYKVL
jgi:hypothetical protein